LLPKIYDANKHPIVIRGYYHDVGRANKRIAKLQRKVGTQRRDWQHKVTSDITSRYDIGVTEELNNERGLEKLNTAASERSKSRTQ